MNSTRKLATYLKPYWHWALLAPLLMVLEVAMDLMQPRMIQRIVDVGIAQRDMQVVIHTSLLMIGYSLIGAIGGMGCTVLFVSMLFMRLARAQASSERIVEVLDSEPEIQDRPDARRGERLLPTTAGSAPTGRVAFERVTFSYDGNGQDAVLKEVSFVAEPGQTVALLGATGAGKSSLVHLIPRFYDVTQGRITIDGVDVRDVTQEALRRSIGIALQESVLFTGTIGDNIRYGRPEATDEEVIAAARLANADTFIHRLPHGYQTELSERASNLSQGQRQLLAIARAILADPGILILDEATSSVDTRTEKHIQEAMLRLMEGRTSFVIAHRLSTIREADKILVINHGEIIEQGTHEELLAQKGFYQHLYMSQFKGQYEDDGKERTLEKTSTDHYA